MKRLFSIASSLLLANGVFAQQRIIIDGNFDDWRNVPVAVTDPQGDVHDTDWFSDGLPEPRPRAYSDVDLLEVKFSNDAENLYGYMRAVGVIGRTSSDTLGHVKPGRYYFIFTIDVDDNDTTGYRLAEGNYWPDSRGYDMNMEVEFYNGGFNTGHYINHEFRNEAELAQGRIDLANGIVRLKPGSYDYYTQWVMFGDSTYIEVSDKGPVYQGIIEIAVSADGHEAEMVAPMWGFLRTPNGEAIIDVDQYINVSASLEASGELSQEAIAAGYTDGSKSFWGSDTAEPFQYFVHRVPTAVAARSEVEPILPRAPILHDNYPNPFSIRTQISYYLPKMEPVNVSVVNVLGQRVATLVDGVQQAGEHRQNWNAVGPRGVADKSIFRSGTYQKTRAYMPRYAKIQGFGPHP